MPNKNKDLLSIDSPVYSTTGILLVNSGTPDSPTEEDVRAYLKAFLRDKQVVQLPRFLWLPILYGLILPFRPKRTAKLYKKIWTQHGMPMRVHMQTLATKLQSYLLNLGYVTAIELGMNYGSPSLEQAFHQFQQLGIKNIVVLPLYPQYSTTTTQSVLNRIQQIVDGTQEQAFNLMTLESYANHEAYIAALANQVLMARQQNPTGEHLLISFHGIPQRYVLSGDPYQKQCEQTATLLADKLKLDNKEWTLCYQSRFGYNQWLKPATPEVLERLLNRNVRCVDIICPGFPVDCLETLEEIAIRANQDFLAQGGEKLNYIPALNADDQHITMIMEIIKPYLKAAARPLNQEDERANTFNVASSS